MACGAHFAQLLAAGTLLTGCEPSVAARPNNVSAATATNRVVPASSPAPIRDELASAARLNVVGLESASQAAEGAAQASEAIEARDEVQQESVEDLAISAAELFRDQAAASGIHFLKQEASEQKPTISDPYSHYTDRLLNGGEIEVVKDCLVSCSRSVRLVAERGPSLLVLVDFSCADAYGECNALDPNCKGSFIVSNRRVPFQCDVDLTTDKPTAQQLSRKVAQALVDDLRDQLLAAARR